MEEFRKAGLTSSEAGRPYPWGDSMPTDWKSLMDEIQQHNDLSALSSKLKNVSYGLDVIMPMSP